MLQCVGQGGFTEHITKDRIVVFVDEIHQRDLASGEGFILGRGGGKRGLLLLPFRGQRIKPFFAGLNVEGAAFDLHNTGAAARMMIIHAGDGIAFIALA